MKRIYQGLVLAGVTAAFLLGAARVQAQGRGNFDPEQMRQRMMERVKEQLEITKDDEWKVIEPLIQKVFDARRDLMAGGGGFFGRRPRGGEGDQGNRRRFGPEPTPEQAALEKAIDAKASKDELKSALAKYREARKTQQAKLEAAQDDLRKVLTVRQEAIAVLNGWLN